MIAIVDAAGADAVTDVLTRAGETVVRLGTGHGGSSGRAARRLFRPPRSRPVIAMPKKRVAVLISGRGSNMASLIEAAKDDGYPAEIALVVSNRPDAAGLAHARRRRASRPPSSITRTYGKDREAFERALAGGARRPSHRPGLPRRLHAAADAVVRAALAGTDAQHPPCPVAFVQGLAHARAGADGRREDSRRDRALLSSRKWMPGRSSRRPTVPVLPTTPPRRWPRAC